MKHTYGFMLKKNDKAQKSVTQRKQNLSFPKELNQDQMQTYRKLTGISIIQRELRVE